jgi:hypothetical protein
MVEVHDPSGASRDEAMPELAAALDPLNAQRELSSNLGSALGGPLTLRAVSVVRHKPGRRCLIRYDATVATADGPLSLSMLGKVRVHRHGKSGWRRLCAFREAGFADDAADMIGMPEPLGTVPAFHMWLQRLVEGRSLTQLLDEPRGPELAARAAEAAHKIHAAGVATDREHTYQDELAILRGRLAEAAASRPDLAARIGRIAQAATGITRPLLDRPATGIHRDYYADQLVVGHDGWIHVVDLDLYCQGDPAVDIGNFLGHVTEQSLRTWGDSHRLGEVEDAFRWRYLELAGDGHADAIDVYADLTLARHIWLSTVIEGRGHTSDALVALCEERFGLD